MLRTLLALAFAAFAAPATALCTGADFRDRLSDADRATVARAVDATPYAQGLRWVARRDDDRITLIGTMHVFDPRLEQVRAAVAGDIQAADVLLVEAGDAEQAQMEAAVAADPDLFFITEGPTLPETLDDATWSAVMEAARARSIPVFMAAKMEPWYLSLVLSMPPCILPEMLAGQEGLDAMLIDDAGAAGIPVRALEPWDTLFTIMRKSDFDTQVDDLKLALIAPDLQSEMFVAMLDAYFTERIAEIWEVSRIAAAYVPGLSEERAQAVFTETEEDLLNRRNRAWIPVIEAEAASHDRLVVAAGAAHLPGDQGLLALLEAEGWRISPAP